MDSDTFWAALALVLVLEGLFPFLSPRRLAQTFQQLLQLRDGQLRFFGLCSILLGLLLLWLSLTLADRPQPDRVGRPARR